MKVGDLVKHKNLGGIGIIVQGGTPDNRFNFLIEWLGADKNPRCWYNEVWLEEL